MNKKAISNNSAQVYNAYHAPGQGNMGYTAVPQKRGLTGKKFMMGIGYVFYIIHTIRFYLFAIIILLLIYRHYRSYEQCEAPPNMKWIGATPSIGNDASVQGLDSYARLENYLECINTGATPSPSQGLLNGCSLMHKRVTVDGVVPSCPPPTSQPTSGSSTTPPSSCRAISGIFRWNGAAPTYGETGFSSDRITCTGPSPTPTPGNTSFTCQRNDTITPFTPCPTRETFTNYLGELMDWVSGRPDINQQSKNSLLPGYFN